MPEIAPGAAAPTARLPGLRGGEIRVPGGVGLTLLAFYKGACPTCRWAMPFVQSLHDRAAGLHVIGVASDDAGHARAFAKELGLTFPIAIESAPWETSGAYGLTTVPTLFLVEAGGEVVVTSPGFARDDFLDIAKRAAEISGGEPADPFPEGEAVPVFRPG